MNPCFVDCLCSHKTLASSFRPMKAIRLALSKSDQLAMLHLARCRACHAPLMPLRRYASTSLASSRVTWPWTSYFISAKSSADFKPAATPARSLPKDTALATLSTQELLDAGWRPATKSYTLKEYCKLYMGLSKFRLSALIVLSTMAGYAICPVDPSTAQAATEAFMSSFAIPADFSLPSTPNTLSLPVLLSTATGTLLCCAAANALNQLSEVPYDAQMARTRNRVLVRRALTPLHAFNFALASGTVGVATLYAFVNPLTAFLGFSNIVLYSFVYTPLKRISIVNTWIGGVVGAIPPLMGWAAVTNSLDPFTQPGAWALAALLFTWQFPHFNSLAHTLRHEYCKAGYYMIPVTDPQWNARVAFRYSLAFFPICAAFPLLGITTPWFMAASCLPNGLLAWSSYRFWRGKERARDARLLFFASLVHLPVVLVMLMVMKEDVWQSLQERAQRLLGWEDKVEDKVEG
jgi:protoheme IX farnesyltransferase